ncbi:hypothetical protein A3F55_00935 [Candidatus Adlerbacteria bacterium RIFCSPHIGHO2_12_FULL_53_18]|uniref:Uncharacterized protein n=1 Tax=Candidatus Adlerbacteria bacterium RIFCSPHIGHO2_12_FULL_53_18 TaxID=1797242 RepID=A0A1F4XSD0_9BACT|nr:MAG: hypothetical protein A3F55_00935 [Candidatus Adlerbacteria bacterium RIFCSPHIGHO2_12_FULL_53_18]
MDHLLPNGGCDMLRYPEIERAELRRKIKRENNLIVGLVLAILVLAGPLQLLVLYLMKLLGME